MFQSTNQIIKYNQHFIVGIIYMHIHTYVFMVCWGFLFIHWVVSLCAWGRTLKNPQNTQCISTQNMFIHSSYINNLIYTWKWFQYCIYIYLYIRIHRYGHNWICWSVLGMFWDGFKSSKLTSHLCARVLIDLRVPCFDTC